MAPSGSACTHPPRAPPGDVGGGSAAIAGGAFSVAATDRRRGEREGGLPPVVEREGGVLVDMRRVSRRSGRLAAVLPSRGPPASKPGRQMIGGCCKGERMGMRRKFMGTAECCSEPLPFWTEMFTFLLFPLRRKPSCQLSVGHRESSSSLPAQARCCHHFPGILHLRAPPPGIFSLRHGGVSRQRRLPCTGPLQADLRPLTHPIVYPKGPRGRLSVAEDEHVPSPSALPQ